MSDSYEARALDHAKKILEAVYLKREALPDWVRRDIEEWLTRYENYLDGRADV